jgi:hypothetical protein
MTSDARLAPEHPLSQGRATDDSADGQRLGRQPQPTLVERSRTWFVEYSVSRLLGLIADVAEISLTTDVQR